MEERVYRLLYEREERHWWFRGRRAVIRAMLARTRPFEGKTRWLDAGCGTGRHLQEFSELGEAVGIDPSAEAVAFCERRGLTNVIQAGVESLPFDAGSFDLILATDVIEHVADQVAALRELKRVATPGAHLLLTVPAYMWMWGAEDERLEHARRYTRSELGRQARAGGWEPQLATYFNSLLLPPIALARLVRRGRRRRAEMEMTPAALDGVLALPLLAEARLIRAGVRLPAGVSIGMVCRAADSSA